MMGTDNPGGKGRLQRRDRAGLWPQRGQDCGAGGGGTGGGLGEPGRQPKEDTQMLDKPANRLDAKCEWGAVVC